MEFEPGKSVKIEGWADRLSAEAEIEAGRRRFEAGSH
jgi:inorganic pyrophosphatase